MKKYLAFFRMRFINGLQYRVAAAAGIVTQFVWGLMEICLFHAFYRSSPESFPMTMPALISYIWLNQAFLALYMTWFWENELFESITTGNVAYELCRPVRLYHMWFVRGLAVRLSKAALRCIPVLFVAFLLPAPFRMEAPDSAARFVIFLFSMMLGLIVVVAFGMLVYLSVFFTISSQGIKMVVTSASEFLSGSVIPLPFLPDRLRSLVELLPFASMQNVPFRIYSGDLAGVSMVRGLSLQAFWAIALILAGMWLESKALYKVVIQGG